ncbi:MAG: hypothetical protein Q3988_03575 [Gemella sp.]|nr:hypothetical protein [Gemella sp.]
MDRLLKILITIATLIILSTLAVLAFLNFSSGDSKSGSRSQGTTTVRQITSTTNSTSKSTTESSEETSEASSESSRSTRTTPVTTVRTTNVRNQTQDKPTIEEAIRENANEGRGERVEVTEEARTTGRVFATQAEAHAFAKTEVVRVSRETSKYASYVITAVRDASGKVTGWRVDITS